MQLSLSFSYPYSSTPANATRSVHFLIKKYDRAVFDNTRAEYGGQFGDDSFQRLRLVHGHGFPADKILSQALDEMRSRRGRRVRTIMCTKVP